MTIAAVQNTSAYSGAASSVVVHLNATAAHTFVAPFCLPFGASVLSVVSTAGDRFIQAAYASSPLGGNAELWTARGLQGGSASVIATFSSASVAMNLAEFSGLWYVSVIDTWSQMLGTGASVIPQTVSPRTTGDLIVTVANSSASISGPIGGFTALSMPGNNSYGAAYDILSGSVAPAMRWNTAGGASWCAIEAALLPANSTTIGATTGPVGINPLLQFPETLVQLCESPNYLAPQQGIAMWTDVSSYFESGTLGPLGRAHMLDRIQATSCQLTMNGREGVFMPWNTSSFLAPGGLDPMTPVKVTGAWNGITSPVAYAYAQSFTPTIIDAQNVDVVIAAYDILQMLSLGYISSDNYAQQVIADGGANLQAYYRFGDPVGSYSVLDSSGIGNTGSLIAGQGGTPTYGNAGPFLYDPSTSLDMTAGTNVLNGGITATDNSTQPPSPNDPLSGASSWTFECWIKNTSTTATRSIGSTISFLGGNALGGTTIFTGTDTYPAGLVVGDLIAGPGVPTNTYITNLFSGAPNNSYVGVSASCAPTGEGFTTSFIATPGGVGSTLFAATSTTSTKEVDIRIGTFNAGGSVGAVANSVLVGPVLGSGIFSPVGFSSNQQTLNGAWHQVAVSYAASVATIYVDGALDSTWPSKGDWTDPSGLTIGCDAGPSNGWVGLMSDVALYSASLSASQISNHYNIGKWFQSVEYGCANGAASVARFNKLMAVEGLNSTQMLNVPYPWRTLMYAETNNVTTTSGLNYMQTMSETEPGLIFAAPNGQINAYSRQYQYLNPTSTASQGVFGDSASVAFHFDGPSFSLVQDDLDEWTTFQVQSGRSGSQLQQWSPVQSPALASAASAYGSRTLQGLTSLQQELDSDALAIAQQYANFYGLPLQRVESIAINSQGNQGNNISQMLRRGIYDRITCQYQGQTPGPQFNQDSLIESITHTVNVAGGPIWTTQWALSPYEILNTPFIFGASVGSASNQLGGAASVTNTGASVYTVHTGVNHYLSGIVTIYVVVPPTVAVTVPYNATQAQILTALDQAGAPSVSCAGQFNTGNVVISFSTPVTFSAVFTPSQVLTL